MSTPSSPRRTTRRPLAGLATILATVLALLAFAAPAAAYVIYLKDGSKIIAQDKYEVRQGKAYITLPNGTKSFIDASEIDLARTTEANRGNYGTALVIDGEKTTETPPAPPPPKKTLGDLIQENGSPAGTAAATPKPPRRDAAARGRQPEAERTRAGYPDLAGLPRKGFTGIETAAALKDFFRAQGVVEAEIFQGTAADRPLVEVTTGSEAAVLRTVATAAAALVHLVDQGKAIPAIELYLETPAHERAGQFVITPEMAAELLTARIDITDFFVDYVQF